MPEFVSRYDGDPLIEARRTHRREYRGHPDGPCCMGCETSDPDQHVTFPCAVVNRDRCEYAIGEYRCIQANHGDDRHLVENRAGMRMVASPA